METKKIRNSDLIFMDRHGNDYWITDNGAMYLSYNGSGRERSLGNIDIEKNTYKKFVKQSNFHRNKQGYGLSTELLKRLPDDMEVIINNEETNLVYYAKVKAMLVLGVDHRWSDAEDQKVLNIKHWRT